MAAATARRREPDEGAVVLRRCVATATMGAPGDEETAEAALAGVPDLADSATARRRALARWLHALHPGLDYWNPLRPDPLADQLLADLDVLPDLALAMAARALDRKEDADS